MQRCHIRGQVSVHLGDIGVGETGRLVLCLLHDGQLIRVYPMGHVDAGRVGVGAGDAHLAVEAIQAAHVVDFADDRTAFDQHLRADRETLAERGFGEAGGLLWLRRGLGCGQAALNSILANPLF